MDSAPISEAPETSLHFLDYWRIIRLRKSLILMVFFLIVLTTTLVAVFLLPQRYASTAVIEVQKDAPNVSVSNSGATMPTQVDPYFLTTQFKIIESSSIINTVITNLNLTTVLAKDDGSDEPWPVSLTYDRLVKQHLSVQQTRGTSLIEIEVTCKDKNLAAKIANAIVISYRQNRLEKWRSTHSSGIQSWTNQIATKGLELKAAEDKLRELFNANKIPDTALGEGNLSDIISIEPLKIHQRDLEEAKDNYIQDNELLKSITNMTWEQRMEALPSVGERGLDPQLGILNQMLGEARMKYIDVTNNFGPKSPEYQSASNVLQNADREYTNRINGVILGLLRRVDKDQTVVAELKHQVELAQDEYSTLAKSYQPYFTQKRDVERLRKAYDELTSRASLAEVESIIPLDSIVTVTAEAIPGTMPVSPHTTRIIIVGVVVGLVFGLGLAFFIEYLDTSVKTIDDVEHALQAPVLGVIPQNVGNILEEGPDTPHAEAYRVLQTNILFSRKEDKTKNTISVLSAGAGEGKSTTLFNLATVFAQGGQRVLVVDSDLRRPSIHKILKVSNAMGLTDLLLKQHTLDEVIQKTVLPTLEFIPSGKLPGSAMSILGSTQMKELIQELKTRYDFVFFDSPPLLGVHDAALLASEMDMVLQVVQYRRYPQPMTLRAKQMIAKVGGNLLGLVLNNINMSQDENYYYYSGYYEYSGEDKKPAATGPKDGIKAKY